jgi:uncharacterized protein
LNPAHRTPIESHAFEEENDMTRATYRLNLVHQRLDELLRREQRRRLPNPFRMMRLKRLKLAVKDRLFRLARTPGRA